MASLLRADFERGGVHLDAEGVPTHTHTRARARLLFRVITNVADFERGGVHIDAEGQVR